MGCSVIPERLEQIHDIIDKACEHVTDDDGVMFACRAWYEAKDEIERLLAEREGLRLRVGLLNDFAVLVSDLDRCPHGRHKGDVCGGCNGPSLGNPLRAESAGHRP